MDPLVLHVFFPRAPALVHAVFIFLRQFVQSTAITFSRPASLPREARLGQLAGTTPMDSGLLETPPSQQLELRRKMVTPRSNKDGGTTEQSCENSDGGTWEKEQVCRRRIPAREESLRRAKTEPCTGACNPCDQTGPQILRGLKNNNLSGEV